MHVTASRMVIRPHLVRSWSSLPRWTIRQNSSWPVLTRLRPSNRCCRDASLKSRPTNTCLKRRRNHFDSNVAERVYTHDRPWIRNIQRDELFGAGSESVPVRGVNELGFVITRHNAQRPVERKLLQPCGGFYGQRRVDRAFVGLRPRSTWSLQPMTYNPRPAIAQTYVRSYSSSGTSPLWKMIVGGPYSPIDGSASRLQATTPTY